MDMNGIFIFDMNTPYKHKEILGNNTFVYDMDEVYCVWQNSYNKNAERTDIDIDFFIKNEDNEDYERYSESFSEYIYDTEDIINIIKKCGFTLLATNDDYSENAMSDTTQRITFIVKKTETIFKDELK